MRYLRQACLIVVLVFTLVSNLPKNSFAGNYVVVGRPVNADVWNELFESWHTRSISVAIAMNGKKATLLFKADVGLSLARVYVDYDSRTQSQLMEIIDTAIRYSGIAKDNKANVTKAIGCLGDDEYKICDESGGAFRENQIGFRFFSANDGRQTSLIVSMIDEGNQFYKESFYLGLDEMRAFKATLEQIPDALKEAKRNDDQKKLFN